MRVRWRFVSRWALFIAAAFAVTMAILPHPPTEALEKLSDKATHMMAFATLAAFAAWGFPKTPLLRIGERLSFLGAMIEVLQSIPALHRDCDIWDWVADTTAITVVLLLAAIRRRWRERGREPASAEP